MSCTNSNGSIMGWCAIIVTDFEVTCSAASSTAGASAFAKAASAGLLLVAAAEGSFGSAAASKGSTSSLVDFS